MLDLLRRSRWIAFGTFLSLVPGSFMGCAPDASGTESENNDVDAPDTTADEITNVNQSAVKRQSIGNCWIYATLGWVESMAKARTGQEINTSESYVTYWDWFAKITGGTGVSETTETRNGMSVTRRSIQTGGSWQLATTLIRQRGLAMEGDFIPEESTAEMSARQAAAESAINTAMSDGGELASREARRDGARVIAVLNRAWNLRPEVTTAMARVFGANGAKRFDSSYRASATGTFVRTPASISVKTAVRSSGRVTTVNTSLSQVMPGGRYAWIALDYPGSWNASSRPAAMRRMLTALNQDQPVIISWLVDFNALNSGGMFSLAELQRRGAGRQGGHLTVLHDYQTRLADGTVFAVGQPLNAADRERALSGTVEFLRVKNSWGVSRSDRASQAGYYDLDLPYLHGPIDWINERNPTGSRWQETPLNEMILPPGF